MVILYIYVYNQNKLNLIIKYQNKKCNCLWKLVFLSFKQYSMEFKQNYTF